jgi:hypothetical protein
MYTLSQAVSKPELHIKIPNEYGDLVTLHEFFKDRDDCLTSIRPLIYLEKYFAIVMEEFKSRTLHEMLMDWNTIIGNKKNLAHLFSAALLTGKLLNVFHNEVHHSHEISEPFQPIIEEVQALFERLDRASRRENLAGSLTSAFFEKIKTLRTRKVLYSNIHGDMTTDNILYSENKQACLVDIKTQTAPIYSDVGLIMIHPDVFVRQIFSFGLFFRNQTIQAYRAAILEGYYGVQPVDYALINLYCAIKMLDKWVMYEEIMAQAKGRKRIRSFFAGPVLRAYFKPRIRKYLDAIQST